MASDSSFLTFALCLFAFCLVVPSALSWFLPLSRAQQPTGQLPRGFGRRRAIERHERGGRAGRPGDLSPPPVGADGQSHDDVRSSVNRLVESNGVHRGNLRAAPIARASMIVVMPAARASERRCEAAPQTGDGAGLCQRLRKKNCERQIVHSPCTFLQQLFHMRQLLRPISSQVKHVFRPLGLRSR